MAWHMRIACRIPKVTNTHTRTHTHNMLYLLLFNCNNCCTNAPQCYVIFTLPVFIFVMLAYSHSVSSGGRVEICQIGPRLSYDMIDNCIAPMPSPYHSFLSNNIPSNIPGIGPIGRAV